MCKKWIAAMLAIAMLLSLSACGGSSDETTGTAGTAGSSATDGSTSAPIVFEETVLIDNEHCNVTVTAIDADASWGYTLKVSIENKTELDLMFSLDHVSVNGYMCDPYWANTVLAGMKDKEDIIFSPSDFEQNGITEVTQIEFELRAYDSNDLTAADIVRETFVLYPLGEAAFREPDRAQQETDTVLFDTQECAMIVTGFDPASYWGYTVNVYLINKTDKHLMFSIGDAAINGYMCDPFWAEEVAAGKHSHTTVSWYQSSLDDLGIENVESLTLPVRVYDADDWNSDYLINETFTVNP